MLVFTRRVDESIIIDNNITITILDTGNTVRIGIDAPRSIEVHRSEVYERIVSHSPGQSTAHDTNTAELAE